MKQNHRYLERTEGCWLHHDPSIQIVKTHRFYSPQTGNTDSFNAVLSKTHGYFYYLKQSDKVCAHGLRGTSELIQEVKDSNIQDRNVFV